MTFERSPRGGNEATADGIMETTRIGTSPIVASRIALGTWAIGG